MAVVYIVVVDMVSRISGPIPPHPCYEKLDGQSHTYLKVPATRVQREGEQTVTQGHGSLCLALEVEGHAMPSAYKHTSLCLLSLFICHCYIHAPSCTQ